MPDVGDFIDDFLQHEYDPAKAREYYLRTRKLKGRKNKRLHADHRSKIGYNGKPLKPRGQRIEEDETPETSPSGAKLVKYDGKGLGKATYSDGRVYDAVKGWTRRKSTASSGSRIKAAEQKLARATALANKVKDPKAKAAFLRRLSGTKTKIVKAKARLAVGNGGGIPK